MKNTEIERKYLLRDESYRELAVSRQLICQGYLSQDPDCTVRVRMKDDKAYITVKGKNTEGGIAHFEWEKEIETEDAKALLGLCKTGRIYKERYIVPWQNVTVEVDVFCEENEGLVLAEIELPTEQTIVPEIPFLAEEVTADSRYCNSYLAMHPYNTWQKKK